MLHMLVLLPCVETTTLRLYLYLFVHPGEAFIPYYYGKAIDGIVVHQSMHYFGKPVITVAVLALVR